MKPFSSKRQKKNEKIHHSTHFIKWIFFVNIDGKFLHSPHFFKASHLKRHYKCSLVTNNEYRCFAVQNKN